MQTSKNDDSQFSLALERSLEQGTIDPEAAVARFNSAF
jgi:hypothetical protein